MDTGHFLCRDETERRRLTDLAEKVRPGTPVVLGVFGLAGLVGAPRFGWLPLAPAAAAAAVYGVVWMLNAPRRQRPELFAAAALLFAEAMMGLSELLAHGPRGYSLVVVTMPVLLAALVFPRRVVLLMTGFGLATMSIVLFGADSAEVAHTPPVASAALFVMVSLTITAYVIRDLDDASRRSAFVDDLTGALNRAALTPKLAELSYRTATTGESVAVIVADIDHFKQINDEHGHATGDAVLREIVRRMTASVSATEPIYRIGGEEFIVLLPGLTAAAAREVALAMRQAIRAKPIEGVAATVSFGVATSGVREPFDFDGAFARADFALYAAKRDGRDRVETAADDEALALSGLPAGARRSDPRGGDLLLGHSEPAGAGVAGRAPAPAAVTAHSGWTMGGPAAIGGQHTVTDELEREFTLELNRRLMILSRPIVVGAAVLIGTSTPWFGWHTLIGPLAGAVPYYVLSWDAHRFANPQWALRAGWAIFQASIAAGFIWANGAPLFALPLFVLLVPGGCAVFRSNRTTAIAVAYTAALMAGVALLLNLHGVLHNPAIVLFPIALLCEAGYVGTMVGRSAVAFRGAGIVDELTGLLNRTALGTRLIELEAQALSAPRNVAIVLADIDHFKQINDTHGHGSGDAVLRALAERINTSLRSFDSAYRVGGEEFLLLLPDADLQVAEGVAERLRHAVRNEPCNGRAVTISLGVAATAPGAPFLYGDIFDQADAALYEAKRTGRDRVCVASTPADGTPAPTPASQASQTI
jgi:diguanylate cyclase (GGDEF)-like protein